MTSFKRGDVVLVDLGYVAKVRPCVVISIPNADSRRNMSVVAPLTTEIRGGECEVPFPKPKWLAEESVVNLIGLVGVDNAKIERMLGPLPKDRLDAMDEALVRTGRSGQSRIIAYFPFFGSRPRRIAGPAWGQPSRSPEISHPAPPLVGWHRRPACDGRRLADRNRDERIAFATLRCPQSRIRSSAGPVARRDGRVARATPNHETGGRNAKLF
jgi:mRNA interferase MazF